MDSRHVEVDTMKNRPQPEYPLTNAERRAVMCRDCLRKEDALVGKTGYFIYCGDCATELHYAEVGKAERIAAASPPA
jgi:hypothetical protein